VIVGLDTWGHVRVEGADTERFLQGVCTVNVKALAPGGQGWGAMLSPKGRVLVVLQATRDGDAVLLHTEQTDALQALLDKYAVMDEVVFTRVEGPAYMVWDRAATAWDAPVVMAAPPGPVASADEAEVMRVEAGMLKYGVDVDDGNFPFETPLARFIDYGKGCYIGQEPVFRVYSQGQAARTMRALVIDGDGPVEPGAGVAHATRDNAGTVTSSVVSPRFGAIALAYLHRTVWDPGGEVTVAGRRAVVRELPLEDR
jgi:folate-binding protein YgfZ